ncbi:hypothetical protein K8352_19845, partial [Flavobacteriaceae bacterium F89]
VESCTIRTFTTHKSLEKVVEKTYKVKFSRFRSPIFHGTFMFPNNAAISVGGRYGAYFENLPWERPLL